jgi:hypothetical protein
MRRERASSCVVSLCFPSFVNYASQKLAHGHAKALGLACDPRQLRHSYRNIQSRIAVAHASNMRRACVVVNIQSSHRPPPCRHRAALQSVRQNRWQSSNPTGASVMQYYLVAVQELSGGQPPVGIMPPIFYPPPTLPNPQPPTWGGGGGGYYPPQVWPQPPGGGGQPPGVWPNPPGGGGYPTPGPVPPGIGVWPNPPGGGQPPGVWPNPPGGGGYPTPGPVPPGWAGGPPPFPGYPAPPYPPHVGGGPMPGNPPPGVWPPGGNRPDQGLPGSQPGIDNTLPPPDASATNPIDPGGQPTPR